MDARDLNVRVQLAIQLRELAVAAQRDQVLVERRIGAKMLVDVGRVGGTLRELAQHGRSAGVAWSRMVSVASSSRA